MKKNTKCCNIKKYIKIHKSYFKKYIKKRVIEKKQKK